MTLGSLAPRPEPDGPGPWFNAGYGGDCSACGAPFDEGDTIRADGGGDWEGYDCCEGKGGESTSRPERFTGTSVEDMGY